MRISLCNEVLRELDFPDQCALARELGYDGLEVAPFTLSDEPQRLASARRAELRRIAEDTGLAITGLHWLLLAPQGLSITSDHLADRMRTVEVMRGRIELCADLGGTILVHGSPGQRQIAPGQSPDVALGHAKECFAAIVREIDSPAVRSMIDDRSPARQQRGA